MTALDSFRITIGGVENAVAESGQTAIPYRNRGLQRCHAKIRGSLRPPSTRLAVLPILSPLTRG